ncbi:MAG TPA: NUDIX domain-containing protein [Phototrophicaceae bacterium]|nr:NUDIX domain-containing protein [Phototrophicaceae bacterium]
MPLVKCRTLFNQTKFVPAESMVQRPSVYGVVVQDRQVLLAKAKTTQKYVLPGGGIERGETMEAALTREIREEAGIEVAVGEFLHFETDFFYYDPLQIAFHGFLFFYHCQPVTTALIPIDYPPEEDVIYARWIAIDQLTPDDFQARGERILGLIARSSGG